MSLARTKPLKGRFLICAAPDCEQKFYVRPSEIRKGRKFCSRSCWAAHHAPSLEQRELVSKKMRDRTGSKNPNFRHGRRIGKHDRELRRRFNLKLKGEDACRVCGSRENVAPHHVIPRAVAPSLRLEILNCLPLCGRHHAQWHRTRGGISREVFTEEEWSFLSTAAIPGQVTSEWLDRFYPPAARMRDRCPNGHPYDEANTRITKQGWRICRECRREVERRRVPRRRAA